MQSVFGLSSMVLWRRKEGPSVLGYGFPGLWIGAGLNDRGLALCWTSANLGDNSVGARVGVSSYLLLTHFLYQESLQAVEEARRNRHAGWFTFVMADADGNLLNVEGSPTGLAVERGRRSMSRVSYGSREMTGTPPGKTVEKHARCRKIDALFEADSGRVDVARMQRYFSEPSCEISVGAGTIDMMVFDTTRRVAHLSRGPHYGTAWKPFHFSGSSDTSRNR